MRSNEIIIGAYTDRQGGVCPMLAAHRNGGRTSFVSFARAWDRYTGARKRARRATQREVLTLTAMLEASLARDEGWDLAAVAAEHRELKDRIEREGRRRTGETDRTGELAGREGWAWLRPFRRYEDFEAALDWLDEVERETAERELVSN
ncbi:MAG: hypothetical protein WD844_14655 [Thermoleophilaceae bacterium]